MEPTYSPNSIYGFAVRFCKFSRDSRDIGDLVRT